MSSPKLLNQFSPVGRVIRRNSYVESVFGNSNNGPEEEKKVLKLQLIPVTEDRKLKKHLTFTSCSLIQAAQSPPIAAEAKAVVRKKSTFWQEAAAASPGIEEEAKGMQSTVVYCKCGRICKQDMNFCEECTLLAHPLEASGYLYVEKDEKNMDRYWFNLINTDLYCKLLTHIPL